MNCLSLVMDQCILSLSMPVHSCHKFQTILGSKQPTCLFLLLMSLRVEGLDQAVCWGRHARNSQFSLKILPLSTIASNIKSMYGPLYNVLVWFLFLIVLQYFVVTELNFALYPSYFSTRKLHVTCLASHGVTSRLWHLIGADIFLLFIS